MGSSAGEAEKSQVDGRREGVALPLRSLLGVISHSSSRPRRTGVASHSPRRRPRSSSLPLPRESLREPTKHWHPLRT